MKTEPGVEPELTIKEEEKEEKKEKEDKKDKEIIKKEEKDREREKERERPTRSGTKSSGIKEEKEKLATGNQPDESSGERLSAAGGPKRKEMEQLKIVRVELK